MTTRMKVLSVLYGCCGAIAGVLLILGILHIWQDHRALHDIIVLINRAQAQPPK